MKLPPRRLNSSQGQAPASIPLTATHGSTTLTIPAMPRQPLSSVGHAARKANLIGKADCSEKSTYDRGEFAWRVTVAAANRRERNDNDTGAAINNYSSSES